MRQYFPITRVHWFSQKGQPMNSRDPHVSAGIIDCTGILTQIDNRDQNKGPHMYVTSTYTTE